jgi:hypothetical protein
MLKVGGFTMRRTRLLLLAVLPLFAAPLLAQDIYCTNIGNTTNCTGGPQARAANEGAELGAGIAGLAAVGAVAGAGAKKGHDDKVAAYRNAAIAVTYCQQQNGGVYNSNGLELPYRDRVVKPGLDVLATPGEINCDYVLTYARVYCLVLDPKLSKLAPCEALQSSPLLSDPFVELRQHHHIQDHDDFGVTIREVFCKRYPGSFVVTANGQQNACSYELAIGKATCTVTDKKSKLLQCQVLNMPFDEAKNYGGR